LTATYWLQQSRVMVYAALPRVSQKRLRHFFKVKGLPLILWSAGRQNPQRTKTARFSSIVTRMPSSRI